MSPVTAAAGCLLLVAEHALDETEAGWDEAIHLEVGAQSRCPWVDLALPPDVVLTTDRSVARLGDGTGHRLGPERFEARPRNVDGSGSVRVHLPELVAGDRAILDVRRHWPAVAPWTWQPTDARFVSLTTPRGAAAKPEGDVTAKSARTWLAAGEGTVTVQRTEPSRWENEATGLEAPTTAPTSTRRLEILVGGGDPQVALFPGGGARSRWTVDLSFPAEERDRAWSLPTGAERGDVAVRVSPSRAARLVERAEDLLVVVDAAEGPAQVTVSWTEADAPTFGEFEPGTLTVVAEEGMVVVENGSFWLLAGMGDRAIIPDRKRLISALERRFRGSAMPEPGLPNALRGRYPEWATAAELRDHLWDRYVPATHTADPLFPRKLIRARKGLALERTEAALFVWLWARQVGLDAGWALARPAPLGPGGPVSPAGFTHALVLMAIDGQTRWIDPSCRVCAPFELPPDLEGADVLSKWAEATPQPTPGSMTVEHGEQGQSRIHLEGSAALSLRLADEPSASLGAAIVEQTGMEEPGAGIDLVVEGSPDPLAIDVVVPWVGTRVLRRRGETVPFEAATALLSYARTQDEDGWIEERLTVQSRTLTPEALRALQDFRSAPPEAAQPDAQAPAPDQEQDEPADDEREEL